MVESRRDEVLETDVTSGQAVEPPWWRPAKPSSRRRHPLSRDEIVDAAIKVLMAEGVDALTVRRLGEELNTGSATLYWHIHSKDELGELVYDRVVGAVELPEPDPLRWQEQIKDLARQIYNLMLRHNDLVRLSLGRIPVGPNMLRIVEWILELARQAGIPDQPAAYFGDMLGRYIDASVLEVTSAPNLDFTQVGDYFANLPADRFRNIRRLSAAMFTGDADDRFEFGLDLLVRGMAAYAKPRATRRPRQR